MHIKMFFVVFCVIVSIHSSPIDQTEDFGGTLIEGDMILPKEDVDKIKRGENLTQSKACVSTGGAKACKSAVSRRHRWSNNVVYYVIDDSLKSGAFVTFFKNLFGSKTKDTLIKDAMNEWSSKTCIRFVERTTQPNYIRFTKSSIGSCYSNVGMLGEEQVIGLGSGCYYKGIIMHEIAHALGFFHEQSRPDRDQYIEINQADISEGYESNFRKYAVSQVTDLGVPYDYESIMHYGHDAFAKFGGTTIRIKQPSKRGADMGQRDRLTDSDVKKMRIYYQC